MKVSLPSEKRIYPDEKSAAFISFFDPFPSSHPAWVQVRMQLIRSQSHFTFTFLFRNSGPLVSNQWKHLCQHLRDSTQISPLEMFCSSFCTCWSQTLKNRQSRNWFRV